MPKLAFEIGIVQAIIWSIRPQDFLLVLPSFLVLKNKRNLLFYISALAIVLGPLLYAYKAVYGFYSGAYGVIASLDGVVTWSKDVFANFMGLLFSPNRGAIVFFPLLLLVPYFWKKYLTGSTIFSKDFHISLIVGIGLYILCLSFLFYWHGGWAYGGRYIYNILPYVWIPITFMINDVVNWISSKKHVLPKWALVLGILCAIESVFIHGLGHYNFDLYVWNYVVRDVNNRTVWDMDELLVKHTWEAGSNAHRWDNTNALKRLREYGF